jgi:hypothetical protein
MLQALSLSLLRGNTHGSAVSLLALVLKPPVSPAQARQAAVDGGGSIKNAEK